MQVGQIEELVGDVPEATLTAAARRIAMLATSGSAQQAEGELFQPVLRLEYGGQMALQGNQQGERLLVLCTRESRETGTRIPSPP